MERTSKLAVAGSLLWVALATSVILGTHGPAVATADAMAPEAATEWLAQPVTDGAHDPGTPFRQC